MSTICGVGIDVSARELTVSVASKTTQSFENNAKGHRAISRLVSGCAKGVSPGLCRGDGEGGDGLNASDEDCDDGDGNSDVVANVCRTDCTLPRCGDGVLDNAEPFNEECDEDDGCVCRTNCTQSVASPESVGIVGTTQLNEAVGLHRIRGNLTIRQVNVAQVEENLTVECVDGDLLIDSNDLTDLSLLSSLVRVGGNITVTQNPELEGLDGIDGLTNLEGSLSIRTNVSLRSLDALGRVQGHVGGYIGIVNNRALTNISGLRGITSAGIVTLDANDILNVNGLEGVTDVEGLIITSNGQLRDIEGLRALQRADGPIRIVANPLLATGSGLQSLASVSTDLIFEGNASLEYLDLAALTTVGGSFTVVSHASLHTLNLPVLDGVEGRIRLVSNPVLETLEAPSLVTPPENMIIQAQNLLPDLAGFASLSGTIPGELFIGTNPALTSLDGLNGIDGVAGRLVIQRNCLVSQESAEAFESRMEPAPPSTIVSENGACL
jgi:hypothetical protein